MTLPADRVGCCITGCRRTFKRDARIDGDYQTICGRHWRMAPKLWRQRGTKFRRAMNRVGHAKADKAAWAWHRTWERCRRYIEDVIAGRADNPAIAQFVESL